MRMLSKLALFATLSFVLAPAVFAEDGKAAAKGASETLKIAKDQLRIVTPETWKSIPPKSNFLLHEFRVPAEGKDFARITFSISGGSIKLNIDRWIGQFDASSKVESSTEKKEIAGVEVHLVDISGTYKDSMGGGPFAPGPVKKLENHRLLGAIIVLTDGTQVFVKGTGPAAVMEENKEAFDKMIEGIKVN